MASDGCLNKKDTDPAVDLDSANAKPADANEAAPDDEESRKRIEEQKRYRAWRKQVPGCRELE